MTIKSQKELYTQLYNRGTNLFKMYNPCNIREEAGKTVCNGTNSGEEGLCCMRCEYLGPNGCTVQSLSCKMWTCHKLDHTNSLGQSPELDPFYEQLIELRIDAQAAKMPHVLRGSKADHFASEERQEQRRRNSRF